MNKLIFSSLALLLFVQTHAQQLNWGFQFGMSSGTNPGPVIRLDSEDNVYHLDCAYYDMDVDPGAGETWLYAAEEEDWGLALKKFAPDGSFLWMIHLPGTYAYYYNFVIDNNGNILVTGSYTTCDFEPGDGETILSSPDSDIFVASYSSDGELNWVSNIEVSDSQAAYSIAADDAGNIFLGGYYSDEMDADPGIDEYIIQSYDYDIDAYIVKLDSNGEFEWAISIGGEMYDYIHHIDTDSQGNIVAGGTFRNTTDFDPGAGVYELTPPNEYESEFTAKYDADGNLLWVNATQNISAGADNNYMIDANDNIISVGYFYYDVDFDPGIGEILAYADMGWYVTKINTDGELVWVKYQEGDWCTPTSVAVDSDGNVFVACNSYGPADMNPGIGVNTSTGENPSMFVTKLNPDGYFVNAFNFEDTEGWAGPDWFNGIMVDSQNHVILEGLFQGSIDVDPSDAQQIFVTGDSSWPVFILSIEQDPCDLVVDITAATDLTCQNYEGSATIQVIQSDSPYTISWSQGSTTEVALFDAPGIYYATVTNDICTLTTGILINGPTVENGYDLEPNLFAWWNFTPGFETSIYINGINNGCLATDGTLVLEMDPALVYISAEPAPDAINGNTLTWNFTAFSYDSPALAPIVTVQVPVETLIGEIMDFTVTMLPVDEDVDNTNNVKNYSYEVVGSFDPNDKQVYPQGSGPVGLITNNQTMTYTVRFQNTGSAPAHDVVITDIIDTDLDLGSMQVIASSHPLVTEVYDNNEIHFVFENIMLPDSVNNEPESHGYVVYTINQDIDLAPGTQITNTAEIYFDFNLPVITNTVLNTISGPDQVLEMNHSFVNVFPNPTSDVLNVLLPESAIGGLVRIYNSIGMCVLEQTISKTNTVLDVRMLEAGNYQLSITSGDLVLPVRSISIR